MERSLLLASLVVSIVCFLLGLMASRPPRHASGNARTLPSALWGFAGLVPVLVWLISFREKAPFSGGHGMGNGVLLGGIFGLFAAKMVLPSSDSTAMQSGRGVRAMAGAFALAGIAAILPQIWLRGLMLDVLMGEALGFAAVTLILAVGSLAMNAEHSVFAARLISVLGYSATALGLVVMGEFRTSVSLAAKYQLVTWGIPGACLMAAIPLVILCCALPSGVYSRWAARLPFSRGLGKGFERIVPVGDPQQATGNVLRLLLAAVLLLIAGKFLAVKIISNGLLFSTIRIGVVAGLLIAALLAYWKEDNAARWMAPLVLVAGGILVFPYLTGVALAIMLLAAWTVPAIILGCAEPKPDVTNETLSLHAFSLVQTFLFGTLFVLYRVCTTRFDDGLRGLTLMDQNVLFALLSGVCVPSLLSVLALPSRTTKYSPFAIIAAGIIALLLPAGAILFWGAKSVLALLIGLSLAVLVNPAFGSERRAAQSLIAGVFALCIALVLCQSYPNLLAMTDVTREQASGLVKWVFGMGIVLYIIAGLVQNKNNNEEATR